MKTLNGVELQQPSPSALIKLAEDIIHDKVFYCYPDGPVALHFTPFAQMRRRDAQSLLSRAGLIYEYKDVALTPRRPHDPSPARPNGPFLFLSCRILDRFYAQELLQVIVQLERDHRGERP
jgi:hypothetical protein